MFIVFIAVNTVLMFIFKTERLPNEFVPSSVGVQINEVFEQPFKEKRDVSFTNTGSIPVFIRATVIINWKNTNQEVLLEEPIIDTDYTISGLNSTEWKKDSDGYYYYLLPVDKNETTVCLFNSIKQIKTAEDKVFTVDIIAEAIQSEPHQAVTDAWGKEVDSNGNLNIE